MRVLTGRICSWAMAGILLAGCFWPAVTTGAAEDINRRQTQFFSFFGGENDPSNETQESQGDTTTQEAEKETEEANAQNMQGNQEEDPKKDPQENPKEDPKEDSKEDPKEDPLEAIYRLYRDKICILETIYGNLQIVQLSEHQYILEGLCYAVLADLKESGSPQLVTVHVTAKKASSGETKYDREYEIWDVVGGKAILLGRGTLSESEGGVNANIRYGNKSISFPMEEAAASDFEETLKQFFATQNTLGRLVYDGADILSGNAAYAEIGSVSASSELPPEDGFIYDASCAVDGDLTTAWTENVDGPGRGEWIQLHLDQEQMVAAVVLNPGYQKTHDTYVNNCFPTEILMEFSDGTRQTYKLSRNDWIGSTVTLPVGHAARASWVRITILKADKGALWEDNCISEIKVLVNMAK